MNLVKSKQRVADHGTESQALLDKLKQWKALGIGQITRSSIGHAGPVN